MLLITVAAGWVFGLSGLCALAIYRVILSRRDHHLLSLGAGETHPLHRMLKNKEASTDLRGLIATIAIAFYTLGLAILFMSQLFETTVHKVTRLLAIR